MGLVQDIQRKIKSKEAEILEIDEEIRALELKRSGSKAYIQGLQDILPKAQKDEGTNGEPKTGGFRSGSAPELVKLLLKKTGKPLHINQILEGIGKPVEKQQRLSLVSTLSRYAREGNVFKKTAPNTFSLIEFDSTDELPAGFGK